MRPSLYVGFRCALLLVLAWSHAWRAEAQTPWNADGIQLSRAELQEVLRNYENTLDSSAYSDELRRHARGEAELIRARLEQGDFQIGDQVALTVEGEPELTGTFTVSAGPALTLPTIGALSLRGVLRSELEAHLQAELSRYIRDPVVAARSSIRLLVSGGVGNTGFHVVPTNLVISDLFAVAGGTTPNADLQSLRVERGNQPIWAGPVLQQAIIEGRTLDQMSIRAGDHVIVPQRRAGGAWGRFRDVAMIVSPIVVIMQLFRNW